MELKELIYSNKLGELQENVNIKEYLSIKTDAFCKNLIFPNSFDALIEVLKFLKNKKYFLLGNGTNVIFSSENEIEYLILLKNIKQVYSIENDILKISSNYNLKKISYILAEKGYGNLEFFSSIPGTIGGSIIMNSGCYKSEVKDYLVDCKCIDELGNTHLFTNEELQFSYRNSILKNSKLIVIEARFKIVKTDENIFDTIEKWKNVRIISQPIEYPNCGSIFRNAELPAWKLIEEVGLRGTKINGALFSPKHCNFIINVDNAKGEDVKELIVLAKQKVLEKFNIKLEEEVLLLNFT